MNIIGEGLILDQYTLIRIIGKGGFGTVWLAYQPVIGTHVALKIIAAGNPSANQRELKAVKTYKKLAMGGVVSGLIPIEHVGLTPDGMVFYVMPLADGMGTSRPEDGDWKPLTLATRMQQHREQGTWFSSQDIITCFTGICKAVQALSAAGLVHRDIKPENILFVNGQPVLSDVSLLTFDDALVTRYGTPGYAAPSWYSETGGQIDMFAIAATLFVALTGQHPDKMGRAAFQWPPKGRESLSAAEQIEWLRLHRVVFRITNENHFERFRDYTALAQVLRGVPPFIQAPIPLRPSFMKTMIEPYRYDIRVGVAGCMSIGLTLIMWGFDFGYRVIGPALLVWVFYYWYFERSD